MQHGLRQITETITLMTSVERVLQYMNLPMEKTVVSKNPPPPNWPTSGGLTFKNVSMKYDDNDPPVLKVGERLLIIEISAQEPFVTFFVMDHLFGLVTLQCDLFRNFIVMVLFSICFTESECNHRPRLESWCGWTNRCRQIILDIRAFPFVQWRFGRWDQDRRYGHEHGGLDRAAHQNLHHTAGACALLWEFTL